MLIFWTQRLAFLATPKAGSTAVESALEPLACAAVLRPEPLRHTTFAQWRAHVGPWLDQVAGGPFTTVALMREPVAWIESWYRFRLRDDAGDPDHPMAGTDFARFAQDYAAPDGPARLGIGTQSAFLTDGSARPDRLFRYEDMAGFIAYLEDQLDCAIDLPRVNVPPSVDVSLDPGTRQALHAALAGDMALYDRLG